MKTKELIRLLQQEDPSGELEVVADDNSDIHCVEEQPAYYDGRGQVLIRDEKNAFYNIIGARFLVSGGKVRLHTLSIKDAIGNNPDMPVDFSELEKKMPHSVSEYKEMVERWRAESREARDEADKWAKENMDKKGEAT
jgi:hypothetical protein